MKLRDHPDVAWTGLQQPSKSYGPGDEFGSKVLADFEIGRVIDARERPASPNLKRQVEIELVLPDETVTAVVAVEARFVTKLIQILKEHKAKLLGEILELEIG